MMIKIFTLALTPLNRTMLNEHRKKCENDENYLEAEIALNRMHELRSQQTMYLQEKHKKQQLDNVFLLTIRPSIITTVSMPIKSNNPAILTSIIGARSRRRISERIRQNQLRIRCKDDRNRNQLYGSGTRTCSET